MYDLKRLAFKLIAHPQSYPESRGEGLGRPVFCNLRYGRVNDIHSDRFRRSLGHGRGYWTVPEQRLTHLFFGQFFIHSLSRRLIVRPLEFYQLVQARLAASVVSNKILIRPVHVDAGMRLMAEIPLSEVLK